MATRKLSSLTSHKHIVQDKLNSPKAASAEQSVTALKRMLAEYKELVEEMNSILMKMGRDGNITFFNNHAQKSFGYSLEEVLGKHVRLLVPESTGRDPGTMVDDILHNPNEVVGSINENIKKDGTCVWISWRNRAIRDGSSHVIGVLSTGQDITALKRSEEALTECERRFASLFENCLDGIMVAVTDGRVVSANEKMCEMLGMTKDGP